MGNNIYNTYINVIENIKNRGETLSIILVGSSRDKLTEDVTEINDIDLFIIVKNQVEDQIRQIKKINNVEFDLNFMSLDGCNNFIKHKEIFFLKIHEGKMVYDVENTGRDIMNLCRDNMNNI